MAGVAKHLKGFPWRYGVGRAGSTAVNAYYLIGEWDAISGCRFRSTQIENLNRRDPAPGSEPGIRGKIFHEYSLPSRDPRAANKPYFCFEGRTATLRRVKLTHSRAATREKLFLCIGSSRISAEPLSDQEPGRSMVYTAADPGSACPRPESPKFPSFF